MPSSNLIEQNPCDSETTHGPCFSSEAWTEENDGGTAVTAIASFESVRHLIDNLPPPRRPERTKPRIDDETAADMAAWNLASDNALLNCESWE